MTLRHSSYLLIPFIAFFLTACNHEIFIENDGLPDITDIILDGNGDEWSAIFSRKGLSHVYVNRFSSSVNEYLTYYAIDGGTVDDKCPFSELRNIVYHSPLLEYSIEFYGNTIYVSCLYNISSEENVTISLDYDHGIDKAIHITMTEGKHIELVSWSAEDEATLNENFEKITHKKTLNNKGPIAQKFEIKPFLDSKCSDVVTPDNAWACGLCFNLYMPVFTGREWLWQDFEDIRIGERRTFSPLSYYGDTLVVEVPANKKATVTYTLYYSRLTQYGSLCFYNPVEEREFWEDVTWTSIYATSYDYTVEYE